MLGAVSRLGHGPEAVPMEAVRNFVESLLESYSVQTAAVASHTDPWSCVFCSSVLEDPVSLVCGHSCCKKCMMRDITGVCRKCKTKFTPVEEDPIDIEPYIKVTVLVSSLVTKYWHKDLEAIKLRGEGNRLYQRGSVKESIEKYRGHQAESGRSSQLRQPVQRFLQARQLRGGSGGRQQVRRAEA